MKEIEKLGWDAKTIGELDHREVKAPYLRLSSFVNGENGDIVYSYDIRISKPNETFIKPDVMHSFEHLLLAGFRKYLNKNFICVAPMGCQTGFYLVLINEGRLEKLHSVYFNILNDIVASNNVPYSNIQDCGQYSYHDLENSKKLAKKILENKSTWNQII